MTNFCLISCLVCRILYVEGLPKSLNQTPSNVRCPQTKQPGRSTGSSADQLTELFNGKLERAVLWLSAFHLLPPSAYLGAHPF